MSDAWNEFGSSAEPLVWEDVWEQELDQIELRRTITRDRDRAARGEPADRPSDHETRPDDAPASDESDRLSAVTRRALSLNLVGLAFSGGGIRSATFNLGMLQGLAEQKLLKHVDYLSTVSGGGYIGSWFTTLIRRQKGLQAAESLLHPIRRHQSFQVPPQTDQPGSDREQEPEPIAHLRAYSNYLAPRVGLFSQDSLSLMAAYVRNLTASLLVLLPALISCIAAVRLIHSGFLSRSLAGTTCVAEIAAVLTVIIAAVALMLMGVAIGRIREIRRHQQKEQVPIAHRVHLSVGIYTATVTLLMMTAVSAVWLLSSRDDLTHLWGFDLVSLDQRPVAVTVFFACLAGVCHVLQELSQGLQRFRFSTLVARSVGGAAGGFLVFAVVHWQFWRDGIASQSFDFVAGIPLMLFSWILASKVALALSGDDIMEDEREWWGRLAATTARTALIWFTVTAVVIFGPALVEQSAYWLRGTVTAGWLLSTIGGLIAGRSSDTANQAGPLRRAAVAAVPCVFLVGLICLLALAVSTAVDAPPSAAVDSDSMTVLERLVSYEDRLKESSPWTMFAFLAGSSLISVYASRRIDVNSTSLNNLYANRLTRCYLGASRAKEPGSESFGRTVCTDKPRRQPHPWTDFDPLDDALLTDLVICRKKGNSGYDGPFHLFNTAINLAGSQSLARQDRKANSFTLTPLACGNPRLGFRPTAPTEHGHRPGYGGNLTVGRAVAISGAAANPNMGTRTSPALAALMTLFNVRLGWWVGNPRDSRRWSLKGPVWALGSLLVEMMSGTNNEHGFVNLSDGGHFENLGVYELIRRRCRYIIVVDAGADPDYEFEDLSNLVRKSRIDLGIEIQISVDSVKKDPSSGRARWHCAVGAIRYDYLDFDAPLGTLVYIKPVMTGDEPPDLANYAREHTDFPQQTTADQFFGETQFESYRELGHHTAWAVFHEAARWTNGATAGFTGSAAGNPGDGTVE